MIVGRRRLVDAVGARLGVLRRACPGRRRVAVTFDESPSELTSAYLDVLDRLGVPATFFTVGDRCARRPGAVLDIVARGHGVGWQGQSYRSFIGMSSAVLRRDLSAAERVLPPCPGPRYVRPPGGALDRLAAAQCLASGARIAMWSLDGGDAGGVEPVELIERTAPTNVRRGEVLRLHDGRAATVEALPYVVGALTSAGCELVTMETLFGDDGSADAA